MKSGFCKHNKYCFDTQISFDLLNQKYITDFESILDDSFTLNLKKYIEEYIYDLYTKKQKVVNWTDSIFVKYKKICLICKEEREFFKEIYIGGIIYDITQDLLFSKVNLLIGKYSAGYLDYKTISSIINAGNNREAIFDVVDVLLPIISEYDKEDIVFYNDLYVSAPRREFGAGGIEEFINTIVIPIISSLVASTIYDISKLGIKKVKQKFAKKNIYINIETELDKIIMENKELSTKKLQKEMRRQAKKILNNKIHQLLDRMQYNDLN